MPGVVSERDWGPIRGTDTSLCAEDQKFLSPQFCGCPAHGSVVRQAKYVPTGSIEEHFFRKGQTAFGTGGVRFEVIDFAIAGF